MAKKGIDIKCITGKINKKKGKKEVSRRPDGTIGKSLTTVYSTKNAICWIGDNGPEQIRNLKITEVKKVK